MSIVPVHLKDSRAMPRFWKDIAPWSWKSIQLGPGSYPGSYFAISPPLSAGSTFFPLSRWTMSSMESDPLVEVVPPETIIDFGSYKAPPYSRGSTPFPLSAITTVLRSPSLSLSITISTARAGSLVAKVVVTKPFFSSPSHTCVLVRFFKAGGGSKSSSNGGSVSLVRIEWPSIWTGSTELRSKGGFFSIQSGLIEGVVTWFADFLSVCCCTTNVFSTYLWMFPRFRLWGRLQTYFPEQALRHHSPDYPLVLLMGIGHSHCESKSVGCSWVLYWFTHTFLEVDFRPHDKKQEHHAIKSLTLTEFYHLARCWSCLDSPHFGARLSKRWDQVGRQGSLCSLTPNNYEEGANWSTRSAGKHSPQWHRLRDDMSQG